MELAELIARLSTPAAYPHPVGAIEVHQTHISAVFLAGPFAYKIKKPVNLGFLDFSTLEKRKHFCEEEVRLNRRLASHVYLDVIPISDRDGKVRFGSDGPIIDWAVKMQRLPAEATLENRLARGEVSADQIQAVADRIAGFHKRAEASERIASFGRFDVVAQNARDNFRQTEPSVGVTVSPMVFERLRGLTEEHLSRHRDLIEQRAGRGVPRDTHGDLRLEHVYVFPDEAAPNDLVIIDCIEFADRFRYADPVADMAFLAMDLAFHCRRDLARAFADAYFAARMDNDGRALLPYYVAYRAVVRAKVEGMELTEKEIDPTERHDAEQRARAHWLMALGALEVPTRRPCLLLIAGLPGSGKSTLAQALAGPANVTVLRSDVIRKELAGASPASAAFGEGIYAEEWTERTYAELAQRAERLLWQGQRVLIDANLREERRRRPFLDLARRWGVPIVFVQCQANEEVTRARLQARHGDASDADWWIYEQLKATWQPFGPEWQACSHVLDTSSPLDQTVQSVEVILDRHV